jgi:putative MATE family efflux protein
MAQQQAARRPGVNVFDESKPMWQTMLVFLIPLMISNVLQSTQQTFSFVFLGRMLGVNALAAVSAVFPVVFLLFSFLIGIGSGSSILIGQAFGAGDHHRVKKIAGTVLGATMLFSIVTMLIGVFFSPIMLQALGTPASIIGQSDLYTRVVFLTFPLYFPYIMYTVYLRGVGDTQTPLRFLVLGTALSMFFTPMLIRGWFGLPQFGVISVALSSLLATIVAFPLLLWHLKRTNNPLAFDRETAVDMVNIDWRILWLVLRIGIPTGLQTIMVSLAEIAVISFVNRYGPSATAAYGAVNQVIGYVQFPAISMSITASIFGAQCIGARREDKLGEVVRSAVALNYAVGGTLILICYLFSWNILGWFITDAQTLGTAHTLLMITLWSYLLFGNSAVISGVVRSSGDVLVPTINGIGAIWLVEVPAAFILMHYFGLNGVWMGYPISYVAVLCAQFTYYEMVWKKKTHERMV